MHYGQNSQNKDIHIAIGTIDPGPYFHPCATGHFALGGQTAPILVPSSLRQPQMQFMCMCIRENLSERAWKMSIMSRGDERCLTISMRADTEIEGSEEGVMWQRLEAEVFSVQSC